MEHSLEAMVAKLEIDIYNTLKWFDSNSMVANPSKFQVMFLSLKKDQHPALEINCVVIANSREVNYLVLPVVNFIVLWISARLDNELNFFVEYIIRLNQPDIYNYYINLVCLKPLT